MGIFFVDINECEEISDACKGGLCLNLPGTFLCECPEGLLLSSDGQSCQGLFFSRHLLWIHLYSFLLVQYL